MRDAFIENDVLGNTNSGVIGLSRSNARRSKKKNRKHRAKTRRSYKHRRKSHKKVRRTKMKRSKGGIHYTKKGQPYKILANGRARFIKK